MPGSLQTLSFGPFTQGLVDSTNPAFQRVGALQAAGGLVYVGEGALAVRDGTTTTLTLQDGVGGTATTVCAIVPFGDTCLIVGHSSATQAVYLYRVKADLTGWYDNAGSVTSTATPSPVGTLWSSVTTAPDVQIAEGLGVAYIAHCDAATSTTLAYPTKTFTTPGTIATLTSDLDADASAEDLYFAGVIAFQQHLWGWGVGSGITAGNHYDPSKARFSQPIFDTSGGLFRASDSVTVGHRVRSARERIVGAGIAGESLYLGASFLLTRVTGYGRDSWYKEPVDQSHGFVGPKCMVTAGDVLYYWSSRGPMRITPRGAPEPLWDRIAEAVATVINPAKIVAGYDEATDQVVWIYDAGSGVRTRLAYDVRRNVWLGPDDAGVTVHCAGTVAPIVASTVSGTFGPSAAPTTATTTSVGTTSAIAGWTAGDSSAASQVEVRVQGTTTWTVVTSTASPGVSSYTLSGLTADTAYEWRVAHRKDGILSTYLGPVAGSQFTTNSSGGGGGGGGGTVLTAPSSFTLDSGHGVGATAMRTAWINSGESGVSTEVWLAGPTTSPVDEDYTLQTVVGEGVASVNVTVTVDGTYWGKARHSDTLGNYSAFTAADSGVAIVG